MSLRDVEVVITGFGAVTGAGDDHRFRAEWLAGRSAVRPLDGDVEGLPPGYGAQVAFTQKELRALPGGRGLRPGTMTEFTYLACGAVGRALLCAGITSPEEEDEAVLDRRGIYLGSYTNFPELKKHVKLTHVMAESVAAARGEYVIDDGRIEEGMKGFTGFDFLKLMNNMPTAHGAIQAGARGPANTFLGHAPVGLMAVARAADALLLDLADQMIAGGTGPGASEGLTILRHGRQLLASARAEPARAARPLDQDASGLVPGDVGAAVVLETAAHAEARGARPLARVVAWRDAFTAPATPRGGLGDGAAIVRLLRALLADAGWAPGDVDYVAPSGLGLACVDRAEAAALGAVFGPSLPELSLGLHTGVVGFGEGGHAALGLVGALQTMADGLIAPTLNFERPWEGLARAARVAQPIARDVRRAVILATSPEGTIAAVAITAV